MYSLILKTDKNRITGSSLLRLKEYMKEHRSYKILINIPLRSMLINAATNIIDSMQRSEKKFIKNVGERLFSEGYKQKNWHIGLIEIMIFLFFEVEFALLLFNQDRKISESLMIYFVDKLIEELGMGEPQNYLKKVFDKRCLEYSEIVNSREYRGTQELKLLVEPLFNNMLLSMEEGTLTYHNEGIKPLALDFWGSTIIKTSYFRSSFIHHFGVKIFLKHLFQNNADFTLLSQDEIDNRITDANKEIKIMFKNER